MTAFQTQFPISPRKLTGGDSCVCPRWNTSLTGSLFAGESVRDPIPGNRAAASMKRVRGGSSKTIECATLDRREKARIVVMFLHRPSAPTPYPREIVHGPQKGPLLPEAGLPVSDVALHFGSQPGKRTCGNRKWEHNHTTRLNLAGQTAKTVDCSLLYSLAGELLGKVPVVVKRPRRGCVCY